VKKNENRDKAYIMCVHNSLCKRNWAWVDDEEEEELKIGQTKKFIIVS
jgi:hypothetical protein